MAATSLHAPTRRWLTSFRFSAEPVKVGDTPCLSIGHPLRGGEFTTYRLAEPVAHDEDGTPLFDLDEAQVEIASAYEAGGEPVFATRAEITEAIEAGHEAWQVGGRNVCQLKGLRFERGGFGNYRLVEKV